jgi:AbrB family looped-hinge helix DNA binding protein
MSSRGQVVIPQTIRDKMGLKEGVEFVVVSEGDSLMLKIISPPSVGEFRLLQKELQKQGKDAGLKPKDIEKAIRSVRGRK